MKPLPALKERELVYLVEGEEPSEYGKRPEDRTMEELLNQGVINIDKPAGPTSHEIVSWVKEMLDSNRTGQGGTLDPNVTGVLPIALGEATKGLRALLEGGKEYVGIIRLHRDVKQDRIHSIVQEFTTKIYQTPPVKSAVKRERRVREIYYSEVIEIKKRDVLFKIGCEAGTYVRTFAKDIGTVLGCGANMAQLRRTRSALFTEDDSVTLHDLKDAYVEYREEGNEEPLRKIILPQEEMFKHLPVIIIRDSAVDAICHGADLARPGVVAISEGVQRGEMCILLTQKGEAVALGKALKTSMEMVKNIKGISANITRVIMVPGTYPKLWKSGSRGR